MLMGKRGVDSGTMTLFEAAILATEDLSTVEGLQDNMGEVRKFIEARGTDWEMQLMKKLISSV